ncbi:hypothetical protein ANCDUO_01723 [Ancylostoma duodenale]|uniref:Uncharacterized protein n=1 Tax=Ancylostoma duodenale TaxID=51022 RepID=A0A0C2DY81_9BILA|nr:hypothetical protein ANCDUO_01723 [Ancylostoma duodenale]
MENYLRIDSCGNLNEAVPESLKNMLLVMASTGLFASVPGLHQMTVSRMGNVLPQLIRETLPATPPPAPPAQPEPASLTSVASASRFGGSRVQIAPAIPSPAEESLPVTTSAPVQTTAAEATPSSAVQPPSANYPTHSHSSEQPSVPAAAPVNIPLTEVVVYSGAASPASPPSPVAESPPFSTASQYSMVSSGREGGSPPQAPPTNAPTPTLGKWLGRRRYLVLQ